MSPLVLQWLNTVVELWDEIFQKIRCPILILHGDSTLGSILSEEEAMRYKSFLPHVQIEHIPNSGHVIRRDQFDIYMETVSSFLRSVVH